MNTDVGCFEPSINFGFCVYLQLEIKKVNSIVYYESMERKLLKPIYECRCNGRLQTKSVTRLTHRRKPRTLLILTKKRFIVVYYKSKARAKESI